MPTKQELGDGFNFAYMYCDYQKPYSAAEVIGQIIQQLLDTRQTRRGKTRALYVRHGRGKTPLDLPDQVNLLS